MTERPVCYLDGCPWPACGCTPDPEMGTVPVEPGIAMARHKSEMETEFFTRPAKPGTIERIDEMEREAIARSRASQNED